MQSMLFDNSEDLLQQRIAHVELGLAEQSVQSVLQNFESLPKAPLHVLRSCWSKRLDAVGCQEWKCCTQSQHAPHYLQSSSHVRPMTLALTEHMPGSQYRCCSFQRL